MVNDLVTDPKFEGDPMQDIKKTIRTQGYQKRCKNFRDWIEKLHSC